MVNPIMTAPSQPDSLHEELWELVYGLLDEARAAALIERIRSDPAVARRYAEVRLQADLLRDAARLQLPNVSCVPPADEADVTPRPAAVAPASPARDVSTWWSPAGWLAAAASLALGIWCLKTPPAMPPLSLTAVELEGPPALWEEQPAQLRLRSLKVLPDQVQPSASQLAIQLVDRQGKNVLWNTTIRGQDDGTALIDLPADKVRLGVQLRVAVVDAPGGKPDATAGGGRGSSLPLPDGSLQCDLPVERSRWVYEIAADPPQAPRRSGKATLWQIDLARRQLVGIEQRPASELATLTRAPRPPSLSASGPALPAKAALTANAAEAVASPVQPGLLQAATREKRIGQAGGGSGRLTLDIQGLKERYQPGEEVRLVVHVTDDNGAPVPATIAARVWDERWMAPEPAPLLAQFLPSGLSNEALRSISSMATADEAAEPITGERAGSATLPPATANGFVRLASTRELVQHALREAVQTAQSQAEAARWRGGLSLVALAALLAVGLGAWTVLHARPVHRSWVHWAPGLSLVAASLLVALWGWQQRPVREAAAPALAMAPSPAAGDLPQAAFEAAPDSGPQPTALAAGDPPRDALAMRELQSPATALPDGVRERAASDGAESAVKPPSPAAPATIDRALAVGPSSASQPPASPPQQPLRSRRKEASSASARREEEPPATLYFNADLQTDAEGRVSISFTLPSTSGRYRLLLDAIGAGKVASAQHVIAGEP